MTKDKDYIIKTAEHLRHLSYPVEDFESAVNATLSNFMVGADDFWHNGFHLYSKNAIKNIYDGRVVAYRLTNDYKMYELFKDVTLTPCIAKAYQIEDNLKIQKYFDKDEKNEFKLKPNLSEEEKTDLYRYFDRVYSNNFILMEYAVKNSNNDDIKFYGLYNHLKPLQRMTVKQKMRLEWYTKKLTITSFPRYNYIQAYDSLSSASLKFPVPELEIPSETSYSELPFKCIQWTHNSDTYQGYIDNSYIVSWDGKKREIKSVNDSGKDTKYLKSTDENVKNDKSKILIYDVQTRDNRKTIASTDADKDYRICMSVAEFQEFLISNENEEKKAEGMKIYFTDSETGYVYLTNKEISKVHKDLVEYMKVYGSHFNSSSGLFFNAKKGIRYDRDYISCAEFSTHKNTNYVKVNAVKKTSGTGDGQYKDIDYIPCETEISFVQDSTYLYIQWILNDIAHKGYVRRTDIRIPEPRRNFREVKRANNIFEPTNNDYYLLRNSPTKNDKILIYTTGNRSDRNVKGYTSSVDFIIEDINELTEIINSKDCYNRGIKVSYNNSKDSGYIYLDWDENEKNAEDEEERKKSKDNIDKKIKEAQDQLTKWLDTVADKGSQTFGNIFTISYELSKEIVLDEVVMPNDMILKKDCCLGYAGYSFFKQDEKGSLNEAEIANEDATSVHFEIFADNIDFMKLSPKCKNYAYELLVKEECVLQTGKLVPDVHNKKVTLKETFYDKTRTALRALLDRFPFWHSIVRDEIGDSIENCLLEKGKTVTIADETFTELRTKARIRMCGDGCYLSSSDLGNRIDNAYYCVKEDKTIPVYGSDGKERDGLSVNLFTEFKYLFAGKKENTNLRRVKFTYDRVSVVENFFVRLDTLRKMNRLKDEYYVCESDGTKIPAEEILQEPKEQKWDGDEEKISCGTLVFENRQCVDGSGKVWERVRTQGGTEGWIRQDDISEEGGTPVKKIVYDRWDKFFSLIDLCKYGSYHCERKDDFLKEFGLRLGESSKVSEVMKWHKELLLPAYYKKESEWLDSDGHTDALIRKYQMNRNAIMQERIDCEFWDGLNENLPRKCYYFNPKGFLNHLDKVADVSEFNPYAGMTIRPRFAEGNDPDIEVKSNPGFAPAISIQANNYDIERFPIKKTMNGTMLYWATVNYDFGVTEGYGGNHSGIDLAGYEGTSIYALVNGIVWATTYQITTENTYNENIHCYGRMMVIKGDNNKLYLLGHLSKFRKEEGERIQVGDIVAEVGDTGYSFGAHLHLEVFKCNESDKLNVINDCNERISHKWLGNFSKSREEFRYNPFNHSSK